MTHTNVVTMKVPITAYIIFNVWSVVLCSFDCDVTVDHINVSYYILIKTKHSKFKKKRNKEKPGIMMDNKSKESKFWQLEQ